MHTPFDNPVPDSFIERIQHYMKDIAWGVVEGLWSIELYSSFKEHTEYLFPQTLPDAYRYPLRYLTDDVYAGQVTGLPAKFIQKWVETEKAPELKNILIWDYVTDKGLLILARIAMC